MKVHDNARDVIALGASAGGVEALMSLVSALPFDLPAAIFVVLHIPATPPSMLSTILGRSAHMRVAQAVDRETIEHGCIYVAPPNNHLLVEHGRVRVVHGPHENGYRPAVDPLFRSAAEAYGPRVVGVVLTGTRDCGTAGLVEVKRRGGIAVAQDPATAMFPDMPQSAIDSVAVDYILPLVEIPPLLVQLARPPEALAVQAPRVLTAIQYDPAAAAAAVEVDVPEADFTCPACGGDLTRTTDGPSVSYRCKVGHRYSPISLEEEQTMALETALWVALRTVEDNVALSRRLASRAASRNHTSAEAHYAERVRQGEALVTVVRQGIELLRPKP